MVLSGRGAQDLADHVGIPGLCYAGNHGAEYICDGAHRVMPGAAAGKGQVSRVLEYLKSQVGDPALVWEDKVFSASVHYRRAQNTAGVETAIQAALAEAPGLDALDVFWGNKVLEIRPRTSLNKGHAIDRLIGELPLGPVLFIGDDTTDIDGMRAIREARETRRADTLGVVVVHPGTPRALIELADYRVGSVGDVGRFLEWVDGIRDG
jgi:trehalose-phosphatase